MDDDGESICRSRSKLVVTCLCAWLIMAHVEQCLFSDFQRGREICSLKSAYMTRFQITARQFNSIRVSLEGKIDSIRQQTARRIQEKELQIKSIEDFLLRCRSKKLLHQKKRRLAQLSAQLKKLKIILEEKHIPLCFGSRKLFHQQFNLTENGYHSHAEWRVAWKKSRCSEIFLLGSKTVSICELISHLLTNLHDRF